MAFWDWIENLARGLATAPVELKGSLVTESKLVDNLAKRDTVTVISPSVSVDGQRIKRLIVLSTLDQSCSVYTEVSHDNGSTWLAYGGAANIGANAGISVHTETSTTLLGLAVLEGLLRVKVIFGTAPTSGLLDIRIQLGML